MFEKNGTRRINTYFTRNVCGRLIRTIPLILYSGHAVRKTDPFRIGGIGHRTPCFQKIGKA